MAGRNIVETMLLRDFEPQPGVNVEPVQEPREETSRKQDIVNYLNMLNENLEKDTLAQQKAQEFVNAYGVKCDLNWGPYMHFDTKGVLLLPDGSESTQGLFLTYGGIGLPVTLHTGYLLSHSPYAFRADYVNSQPHAPWDWAMGGVFGVDTQGVPYTQQSLEQTLSSQLQRWVQRHSK